MSDQDRSLTDAEKIRLARVARLGGTSSPAQSQQQPTSSESPSAEQQTPAQARPPPSAASRLLSQATPSSAASSSTPPAPTPMRSPALSTPTASKGSLGKRHISPSGPSQPKSDFAPRVATTPQPPTAPKKAYKDWESDAVSSVFSVTLSKRRAEASAWQLCWLKSLQKELDEEDGVVNDGRVVTPDLIDRVLVARLELNPAEMSASNDTDILTVLAGLPSDETLFEYLTGSWKRLYGLNREMSRLSYSPEEKTQWQALFEKLRSVIITYCGLTLEDPTMFPQPESRPTGPAEFLPILLSLTPSGSSNGDPLTASSSAPAQQPSGCLGPSDLLPFLNDLATGTADTLSDVLSPTFSLFFQQWFSITPTPDILGNDWRKYLGAVATLVQVKGIAALLPTLSVWVAPGVTAPKLEWQSLLGPLTRLSVFPREFAEVWRTYFADPTERKVEDIDANKSNLRHTLNALQQSLFQIYNSIVRSSPDAREGVLDFFALAVKLNEKRSGMRVDPRTVSSDGYMTNLQVILLKLFEPVMDVSFSKIDKIDVDYYKNSSRIDITEETRIKASKEDIDSYVMDVDRNAQNAPNFVSDLFFLLNAFQHLGVVKTIGTRKNAEKNIGDMDKELKRTEASRGDWTGNPALEAQGEAAIKKLKSDIATLHASIHAYDTQLLDPAFTRLNVTFLNFLMTWLVRLVDPKHRHPVERITLPLPAEAPMRLRMLPEYFIENIAEYFDFLARYNPEALEAPDKDVLVTFAITFLSPGYINNPFLKAKLVSALANGLYPVGYFRKGTLYDTLTVNPISTEYLMPTLIRFFIDVEATGGHTQFWDKFTFRRDMSRLFRKMWDNPLHRAAFVKSRHDDFDQFIKFINMLMSDTTFHLEESLTNLAKVNTFRARQADAAGWAALPEAEQRDLSSQLASAESSAPFHTHMGLDHVKLIKDITATTKEPFMTGEIVDRLAASLDENLANLVGPKMQELRLTDPEKFGFKPKELLAGLAQIYLNLSQESDFIRAVANDGRSYTKELFERFARILKHRGIMTDSEVSEVVAFTQKVEDMKATIMIEDEREIPDEFLDPIMSTLMKDPVILPMSKVTIDRATIRTVLLSKEADPFNNQPMKIEDCVPDTELKAKIDAWVKDGGSAQAGDVMDVDKL